MGKHGGRRTGAGAPKGNINALTTGAHSKQIQELVSKAGGFFILDKKRKKMVYVYSQEDLQKLKNGGLEV